MSIEFEREHRRFFTTKVPPPPKPAVIFPTASPRATFQVRSGLYDYPAPSGDENNLIYRYHYDSFADLTASRQAKRAQQQPSNIVKYSFSRDDQSPQKIDVSSFMSRNVSLCNGSPGHVRLAREYHTSKSQSSIMNSSQGSSFLSQRNPTMYSGIYSPSGVY